MNSLFQTMPQAQNIPSPQGNNIINMLKAAKDPGTLFKTMSKTNPQVQQIMQMIQQTNQTPKDLFYSMAQQRGVDPNQVLNMFNQ